MRNPFDKNRPPKLLFEAYLLFYVSLILLFGYLSPLAFSVVLTAFAIIIVLEPVAGWLIHKRRMRFVLAHALTLIVFFSCVLLLFAFLVPSTLKEAGGFFRFVEDFFGKRRWETFFQLRPETKELLSPTIDKIYPKLLSFFESFVSGLQKSSMTLLNFIFYVVLVTAYWTFFFPSFKKSILHLFPKTTTEEARRFLRELYHQLKRYLSSLILVATFVGIVIGIFLLIIGSQYALILGFWGFFTNFISIVGVALELIPLLILCFSLGIGKSVALLVLISIVHPVAFIMFLNLMKGVVQLNPVVIILLILVCSQLFGIVGSLIAVPVGIKFRVYWRSFIVPRLSA